MMIALLLTSLPVQTPAPPPPDARELFVAQCARCHGENGDGQGITSLDRPARSFKDGGFSFGNTQEAIFRTLTVGIPGTPMPGFEDSLSIEQRRALADYVITLGPEVRDVSDEDTVLTVVERARFVRGLLPPIGPGGVEQPRGLLLGTPTGTTFEYRVDDVRLLGLRQGAFVRRRDWSGRGGTALEPLGKVVLELENGTPRAPFAWGPLPGDATALTARLRATRVRGARGSLDYTLHAADGLELARVLETPQARGSVVGAGFTRIFSITPSRDGTLWFLATLAGEDPLVAEFEEDGVRWLVIRRAERELEVNMLVRRGGVLASQRHGNGGSFSVGLPFQAGRPDQLILTRILTTDWNSDLHSALREVVAR